MSSIVGSIIAALVVIAAVPPLFLPVVSAASAPAWRVAFTAQGGPFTDAVTLAGALFISRQDGAVFRDGALWTTIPVDATGEGGLNALASDGSHLWAGYVASDRRITVAEITTGAPVVIAAFGIAGEAHNAAGLLYDNGVLLFGIGDNGEAWQAQSATLAGGKVWAINPQTGESAITAKGLRNPWHLTRINTAIYIADVGESRYEEVNIYRSGANYGWPCYEAFEPRAYDPETCDALAPVAPALTYGHGAGRGVVGVALMNGHLVYADFAGEIRRFDGALVRTFDAKVSKLTPTGEGVVALTFAGGMARAEVWR